MGKKVSIIVPIYKVEKYIEKCIKSICNQTYRNLEIILVDDGSPDECGGICDWHAARDERIKVLHINNSGQSHARNVGLEHATGDYIGFVDGDDWIHEDMYEKLVSIMENEDVQIVECNFHGRKQKAPENMEEGVLITLTGREAIKRQLDYRLNVRYPSTSVWSKLFKRDVLDNLRFPNGRVHEEYGFLCEAYLRSGRCAYINSCLYERTLREDSTTAEKFSIKKLDKLYVYQERNQLLSDRHEEELYTLSKEQEYILLLHYAGLANKAGLTDEQKEIEQIIEKQKKDILKSNVSVKRKLQYMLFFLNRQIYYGLQRKCSSGFFGIM